MLGCPESSSFELFNSFDFTSNTCFSNSAFLTCRLDNGFLLYILLLESGAISREGISRSKSIDMTVPSSKWLFHAFLYFPVAFPDLEIKVSDFCSSELSTLPSSLFLILPFYQVYGQYHLCFLSKIHLL